MLTHQQEAVSGLYVSKEYIYTAVVLDAIEISSPLFKLSNKCRLKIYNGVARCSMCIKTK
jgi:hypothetical protein